MELKIDSSIKYKHFNGFGGSGAWWAQCVGGWKSYEPTTGMLTKDAIAKILFSKENGIGLTSYRYNIGAGSRNSGNGNIENPLRRTFSLEQNGIIDEKNDINAVYMMKKCVEFGAKEVVLFVNSPLERMTKNGKSHLSKKDFFRTNLSSKNYGIFTDYCLDVTEYFLSQGIPVKYLSPVNEPLWIWNGGQEGCHYSPRQVKKLMLCFAKKMSKKDELKNIMLSGAENGDIRWFNKAYARAMLSHPLIRKMSDGIDVHSYCLPAPLPSFFNDRLSYIKRFFSWMSKKYPDVDIKMSEWCHMQGGRDNGMDSALETAKIIYEDISVMNAVSWQHWILCSEVDYCDGLLYINPENETFETTKRLYVTGNFSKYMPSEAVRIHAETDDENVKVLCFTGKNATSTVLINFDYAEKQITLQDNSLVAITDKHNDLTKTIFNKKDDLIIPARSVVTLLTNESSD